VVGVNPTAWVAVLHHVSGTQPEDGREGAGIVSHDVGVVGPGAAPSPGAPSGYGGSPQAVPIPTDRLAQAKPRNVDPVRSDPARRRWRGWTDRRGHMGSRRRPGRGNCSGRRRRRGGGGLDSDQEGRTDDTATVEACAGRRLRRRRRGRRHRPEGAWVRRQQRKAEEPDSGAGQQRATPAAKRPEQMRCHPSRNGGNAPGFAGFTRSSRRGHRAPDPSLGRGRKAFIRLSANPAARRNARRSRPGRRARRAWSGTRRSPRPAQSPGRQPSRAR